ncbi:MAG TPA: tol-pal system protein YbgF [Nitrospinota bacterium]|nr:tol-pal system protein YbgF [Nitrospinota bacterium]
MKQNIIRWYASSNWFAQFLKGISVIVLITLMPACETASKREKAAKAIKMQADMVANVDQLESSITVLTGQIEELNERANRLSKKISKMELGTSLQNDLLERSIATNVRLEVLNAKLNSLNAETMAFIKLMEKKHGISKSAHQSEVNRTLARIVSNDANTEVAIKNSAKNTSNTPIGKLLPHELYEKAYRAFLKGKHKDAIKGFTRYLSKFPESELSDNAAYWLGEAKFRIPDYKGAVTAFDSMAARYPASKKAPTAILRSATASFKIGDKKGGFHRLRSIVELFPETKEAMVAGEKLKQESKSSN